MIYLLRNTVATIEEARVQGEAECSGSPPPSPSTIVKLKLECGSNAGSLNARCRLLYIYSSFYTAFSTGVVTTGNNRTAGHNMHETPLRICAHVEPTFRINAAASAAVPHPLLLPHHSNTENRTTPPHV